MLLTLYQYFRFCILNINNIDITAPCFSKIMFVLIDLFYSMPCLLYFQTKVEFFFKLQQFILVSTFHTDNGHSSAETAEFLQWLRHDTSTTNIILNTSLFIIKNGYNLPEHGNCTYWSFIKYQYSQHLSFSKHLPLTSYRINHYQRDHYENSTAIRTKSC